MNITYINEFLPWPKKSDEVRAHVSPFLNSNVVVSAAVSNSHYSKHVGTLSIKKVFKGEEYYITNNCKYKVNKNNFLILNLMQEYESYIESNESVESFSLFFYPKFAEQILNNIVTSSDKLLEYPCGNNYYSQPIIFWEKLYDNESKVFPALERIQKALNDNPDMNYISEQIYLVIENLIFTQRNLSSQIHNIPSAKRSTKIELFKRLSIAKDYMDSCCMEKISLSDVAKISCMNEHYMLREFKKIFKTTPYKYLTELRLNESKKLLSSEEKSISEISSKCGYEYLSSFSQAFYQRYGLSPAAFRANSLRKKVNF